MEQTIRVDYDDQPNEVADKFLDALRELGVECEQLPDQYDGQTFLEYRIAVKDE